jgi:hypothetical protein
MVAWRISRPAAADPSVVLPPSEQAKRTSVALNTTSEKSVAVLIGHVVATSFMAGVIWYVQLVHYPLMGGWPHDDFPGWEAAHREQTGLVVVPAMLAEGLAAVLILTLRPAGVSAWIRWTGAGLLLAIWVSTFTIQVPLHDRLASGWDAAAHTQLVQGNWLRTVLWSARAVLAAWMLWGWAESEKTPLATVRSAS